MTSNNFLRIGSGMKVLFHSHLEDHIADCAQAYNMSPATFRHMTETAIRKRHHTEATIAEGDEGTKHRPDVFNLDLGQVHVYYTIEAVDVVVRGYIKEHDGGLFDDEWSSHFCSYICESEWFPVRIGQWLNKK